MLRVDQLVSDLSRATLALEEAAARTRVAEQTSEHLREETAALQQLCASVELERDTLKRKFVLAGEEIGAPQYSDTTLRSYIKSRSAPIHTNRARARARARSHRSTRASLKIIAFAYSHNLHVAHRWL